MVAISFHHTAKRKYLMRRYRTRLAELMQRKGLTRMDLVRSAGLSYPTIVSWESKAMVRIDAATEATLCETLGVTRDELVYIVDEEDDVED